MDYIISYFMVLFELITYFLGDWEVCQCLLFLEIIIRTSLF